MTLTPAQVSQILVALSGKVDNEVMSMIKQLLEGASTNGIPPGDTYQQIKSYSHRLMDQFQALGRGVASDDPNEETLAIFMEPAKVRRILNAVPANGYLAALPGIHTAASGKEQVTISLLAADSNMNIVEGHINGTIKGEESWDNCTIMARMPEVLRDL